MIDLSEVVADPDLAEPFTIFRTTGYFDRGGWTAGPPVQIPARGVVTPASDRELDMVPEGDRIKGSMTFHTHEELHLTSVSEGSVSDKILWQGDYYRLVFIAPWTSFGFNKAVGVRMEGT